MGWLITKEVVLLPAEDDDYATCSTTPHMVAKPGSVLPSVSTCQAIFLLLAHVMLVQVKQDHAASPKMVETTPSNYNKPR